MTGKLSGSRLFAAATGSARERRMCAKWSGRLVRSRKTNL